MATTLGVYNIRIGSRLGPTALSAFPSMLAELGSGETVLTGVLEDQSALFGVLGQIEALGLELLEVRQLQRDDAPVSEPFGLPAESARHSPP